MARTPSRINEVDVDLNMTCTPSGRLSIPVDVKAAAGGQYLPAIDR
jgi:hypothetical protein